MKPAGFDYLCPDTLDEALKALDSSPGAMILAGGQSLVPAMNFRLANPSKLIDLKNIKNLSQIDVTNDFVTIGSLVTHRDLELNTIVKKVNPLISEAMQYVAHIPIRNHGTTIGSLCHADAAAEMPLILLLCDGNVTAKSVDGDRNITAEDFFKFHMTTSKSANEIITSARFKNLSHGCGYSFSEFARRHGDYAIAGAGAIIECGDDGLIEKAIVGGCGINSRPVRLFEVESIIEGSRLTESELSAALAASKQYVTTGDDMHATLSYRQHLLSNLMGKVLKEAMNRSLERLKN